jgi:hypothetical protein
MGQEAALLLVGRGRLCITILALALAACRAEPAGRVDPRHYDAFFLWPGKRPPDLAPDVWGRPKVVYLLAGEVRGGDASRMVPLRAVPQVQGAEVWLTVRAERLHWGEGVYRQVLGDLARWQAAGNRLAGLQVDFDAATKGLAGYAAFLADLRRRLPPQYRLSVTGLLDWSAHGDPAALAALGGVVDELVIQTYQGRRTIPGYQAYMAALTRLPVPHKIGLVEGGEWQEPPGLARDRQFRGYVVFMLNRPAT